jgi:NodT family efflux transporter outer membrane factor (OMF) lipoprotein
MHNTPCIRRFITAAVLAAVAGCALNTPPERGELQKQALPNTEVPASWKTPDGSAAPVADRWLATFNDPALSALVGEALSYNANLQAAAARVEQAAGYLKVASASLLPSVGVVGMAGGKSGGDGGGLEGIFINASLELDVWGRVRYGEAAARGQAEALAADYAYARQSLAAMVARSWFIAIEAGLQEAIARDMLRAAETLLRLAQDRMRIGNGNEQAVADARASVANYRDALRQITLSREQSARALESLLGRYPAAEIKIAQSLTAMPPRVPAGLPSQLLERRPDVIAAERRVAAAFNRVGEARAAQLPRISLTAGGSDVSSDLFVLQNSSNPVWSFGANLVAPLYRGGALRAQVEIRTAEQKQAVAQYAVAGQRAFSEVENALAAEQALRERDALLDAAVRDNERAVELAQIQYRVGAADLRSVEQRQLGLYAARTSRLRVQSERLAQRVNLHLALGGGFDETTPGPVAAGVNGERKP